MGLEVPCGALRTYLYREGGNQSGVLRWEDRAGDMMILDARSLQQRVYM